MQDEKRNTNETRAVIQDISEIAPLDTGAGSLFDDVIPWVVEFRVIGSPAIIQAPVRETMMLGRADPASGVMPEIDLGEYNGRHMGVSRNHAQLSARDNRLTLQDLGSSNGTYLNNKRMAANQPYRIREGDKITLGKLELQLHFVVKPMTNDDTMTGLGNRVDIPRMADDQHLLIVDDNRDVCEVLRFVAMRAGFRVTLAYSMAEAIARFDSGGVDGMIIEMMLADGSGLDVVTYVRNKQKELPIVAISSGTSGFVMTQAIEKGASLFLSKPIAIEELVDGLEKLAGKLKNPLGK